MTNHLADSTSPYLRQHAENPVDWYPWGAPALEKARREDKPIFLSIGYSACHWCHVMAHESFEDPAIAALLNQRYVSIKVDREERPDLDGLYMSAVTALTGQGGWPLSVFLTPELQPFYGGTYFPPEPRHGLPAFRELLLALSEAWSGQRDEITRVAAQLAAHLVDQTRQAQPSGTFTPESLAEAARNLLESYDWQAGGWGTAPKFPQPMAIEFLLRRHLAGQTQALPAATHALQSMQRGGMYDVVGGGFARYSTDEQWLVPHFEKMLYDNAQLALVYLHAWQLTGTPAFRQTAEQTLAFVQRELTSPQGGFYSSLDADSPGGEGAYYAWSLDEIRSALGEDSGFFELAYGLTAAGNWGGRLLLQRAVDDASLAAHFGLSLEDVTEKLMSGHSKLLAIRSLRPPPATDEKVLSAWNGLMLAAFAEAAASLDEPAYLETAQHNADFLLTALRPDGKLRRAWRDGRTSTQVFLEDYAALILGLLALYQADFQPRWFASACKLAEEMLQRFRDPAGGFFDTPEGADLPLTRPKDLQDNAIPSGNALAAEALLRLAAFTDNAAWRRTGEAALGLAAGPAPRYPTAFARWLSAADFAAARVRQVAVVGDPAKARTRALLAAIRQSYRPNLVLAAGSPPAPPGSPALLADRPLVDGRPTAYVCEGFVCRQPVNGPQELLQQLEAPHA